MKKLLIALTLAVSCLGISRVSADTIDLVHSDTVEYACRYHVTDYDYLKELGYENIIKNLYKRLIEEYKNYSSEFPYFYIELVAFDSKRCNQSSSFSSVGNIFMFLNLYNEIPSYVNDFDDALVHLEVSYDVTKQVYLAPNEVGDPSYVNLFSFGSNIYNPLGYFISNFDLYYNGTDTYSVKGNSNFTINPGDLLKPVFSSENVFPTNYVEININNYSYVALALKDYTNYNYSTTIYVKGQYCPTTVYGMGLHTSEEFLNQRVSDVCTPYYENYTPVIDNLYESYVKNYPIYYVKAYDTTRDNYIKVDSNIFDITYITEEDKDNPYVTIGGKIYPTIPFDDLPSNALKNTEEGYIPGQGQVNQFSFSDIFTAPLEFLQEIWGTIATFFDLITKFILLLPPVLQGFLYSSFALAIVLGLIKILL